MIIAAVVIDAHPTVLDDATPSGRNHPPNKTASTLQVDVVDLLLLSAATAAVATSRFDVPSLTADDQHPRPTIS